MTLYRTRTESQFTWLMEYLDKLGCEWRDGDSLLNVPLRTFRKYGYETVIDVNYNDEVSYCNVDYFTNAKNYNISEAFEVSEMDEYQEWMHTADGYAQTARELSKLFIPSTAELPTEKHQAICNQLNEIYRNKNHDYGDSFGETYEKLGAISAVTRISDKTNRLQSLVTKDEQLVKDEHILDTVMDLANYAIMFAMELEKEQEE